MKKINIIFTIIFLAAAGLYFTYMQYTKINYDTHGPEISFEEKKIAVSVKSSEDELLKDVKAIDKKDGDVSESVMIEGYSGLVNEDTRVVTYAAFDSDNNVIRKSRKLIYEDYEYPKFALTAPLIFYETGEINTITSLSAQSILDGNLTNKIKKAAEKEEQNLVFRVEGRYPVRFSVTDSAGGKSEIVLYVDVIRNDGNIYNKTDIQLSSYLMYVKAGTDVDVKGNIDKVMVAKEENDSLKEKITIDTNLDTNTPGVYEVYYRLKEEEGIFAVTKLIVIVE